MSTERATSSSFKTSGSVSNEILTFGKHVKGHIQASITSVLLEARLFALKPSLTENQCTQFQNANHFFIHLLRPDLRH